VTQLMAYVLGFCSRGLQSAGLMTGWFMSGGGVLLKGALVWVAYVRALVTGGLCPQAFAQGAFCSEVYF